MLDEGVLPAHPTRQPVTLKLFPPLPMGTVLSFISGRDAEITHRCQDKRYRRRSSRSRNSIGTGGGEIWNFKQSPHLFLAFILRDLTVLSTLPLFPIDTLKGDGVGASNGPLLWPYKLLSHLFQKTLLEYSELLEKQNSTCLCLWKMDDVGGRGSCDYCCA